MMENIYSERTFTDFPIGRRVKIVSRCVDFHFFYTETGVVTENKGNGSYLGITVKFDKPREFNDGMIQREFNFHPKNLEWIDGNYPSSEAVGL